MSLAMNISLSQFAVDFQTVFLGPFVHGDKWNAGDTGKDVTVWVGDI